tara:strand:+ start:2446 stop:3225 length:780 start_codon:yes stop_codon:yes gene_type:complete
MRYGLSDEDRFQFDLQGFLVIPGVLSADECEHYIRLADEAWPRQPGDGPMRRQNDMAKAWGQPFVDLMDHPVVLSYLVELMGRQLRIDHDYCIFMREGAPHGNLHGGPRLFESDHWYRYQDGIMRNGLTVTTWNLTDAPAGAGGFTCIPGSHKTNFLKLVDPAVQRFERDAPYVVQPTMAAGDVLIFTEALIHGTGKWHASHERRALLYKYSPPHSSWRIDQYDLNDFPEATERQRRLMAPPSVEAHAPVVPRGESFDR